MPKRGAAALGLTALALALLLAFRTPDRPETTAVVDQGGAASSGTEGSTDGSGSSGAAGSSGTGSTGSSGSTASGVRTLDGPVIDTRYGPVQVEITVADGKLTDVTAVQLPADDRRSASISSRAAPVLRSEALAAQSADIDGVSGATYTSDGYERSLQAALDAAGI